MIHASHRAAFKLTAILYALAASVAGQTQSPGLIGTGSGFTVSPTGYVLTNGHVVDGCSYIQVRSNGEIAPATIVAVDKFNDMALIKTAKPLGTVLSFRQNERVNLGE